MKAIEICEKIRERRKEFKITQPQLAELAGISKNTLYKLENGLSSPGLDLIEKIAGLLNMELRLEAL